MSKPLDPAAFPIEAPGDERTGSYIEAAYRDYFAALRRQLSKRFGCDATAADIAQSAFVVLAEHKNPEEIRDHKRFLFRVALNLAGSHRRNTARRKRLLDAHGPLMLAGAEGPPCPEQIAIRREDLAFAARIIAAMPRKRRQTVVLSLYHGLTNREIAARIGVSEQNVRTHLSRGLRQCRDALEAQNRSRTARSGGQDAGRRP